MSFGHGRPTEGGERRRRLVRYPDLKDEFGIPWTRQHINRLEKAGKFPKRVHLGPNTVAWWDDSIEEMLKEVSS